VRSGHLYQLLTYLRHIHPRGQPAAQVEGILLYPRTNTQDLRLDYRIAGHRVRVHTLALDRPWLEIQNDLLQLITSSSRVLGAPTL
jgi:hypothetical protein